jgi:NADPH:quinone reductase-like Zn-dependent oxidoreductase
MRISLSLRAMFAVSALGAVTANAATMQAVVVSAGRIHAQSVPRPVPRSGQVLVKIQYAGVNPADWKRASGRPEDAEVGKPLEAQTLIPGVDGSGVIAALGPDVTKFKIGDAVVLWSKTGGTYAQYVAVSADTVVSKPDRLPFAQAAAIPHASLAAWNLLQDVAKVHAGQTVLVLGGAGGVGSAAIQIANIRGAHVIATASSHHSDYLRRLGVESVIDYTTQHFEEQLRNVDVAVNTVDQDNAYRALAVVKRGGYLVSVAGLPSRAQCAARGVICSARTTSGAPVSAALEQIVQWTQSGRYSVNIDRSFEMNEVLQAWGYSQAGHTRGKTVIRMTE